MRPQITHLKLHPSSIPAIIGASPFMKRSDYMKELLGLQKTKFSLEQRKRMWWGKNLEDTVIQYMHEWDDYTCEGREERLIWDFKTKNGNLYTISGRIDTILINKKTGQEIIAEIKTASDDNIIVPKASHKIQLNLYLHLYKLIYDEALPGMLIYFHPTYKITKFEVLYDKPLMQSLFFHIDEFVDDTYNYKIEPENDVKYIDTLKIDEIELFNKFVSLHNKLNSIPNELKKEYDKMKQYIKSKYEGSINFGEYKIVITTSKRESVDKAKLKEYGLSDFIKTTEYKIIKIYKDGYR